MTAVEPAPAPTVDAVVERVGRASDMHEFERAWTEGLRTFRAPDDRDRILAEAGRQLCIFGDAADDRLRRSWLSQVVEEVRTRGGDSLGDGLSSMAVAEMREAFAHARAELEELQASVSAGEGMHDYAVRSPLGAERIRDLGRMAQRLRGSGLMTLVSSEDAGLARELAATMAPKDPLVATVPVLWRVSRDDLLGWTEAASELPRLVRSLIAETVPSVEGIYMPAGSAVSQPGWDGIVRCSRGNRFVPDGLSVWELSAQKNGSDRKARGDYDKRVKTTPGRERADAAYVAVMCARWMKARNFGEEKSQSGDFRLVRTLDADGLEAWLECAPVTTVWLREQLGKPVAGVGLLSDWWARWLDSTTVPLDAPVVLAGRAKQAETLRDRCQQRRGGVITIGGHLHRDEILAFAAAVLTASDASSAEALYVDDRVAAQRLLAAESPSGSEPQSQRAPAITAVVSSKDFAGCLPAGSRHRLIVPVPGSSRADIVLEAADSEAVAGLLQDADMDTHTAYELGTLARMSLLALRRRLAVNPELHLPSWAAGHVGSTIRRCLLLNRWNETSEGDRRIVERFVECSYDEAAEALRGLDAGDAPMLLTDEQWHVVSPADIWTLLSDHITRDEIEAFGGVAHEVLTEPDPFDGMSGSERMRAQYAGVEARHSHQLRRGVATTLALLGSDPPRPRGASAPFTGAAAGIVIRVLGAANDDPNPRTWASVARELPLLAEAAPAEVLRGLRTCISGPHAFATSMFADGDDGSDAGSVFPADSPHLRVIEALEVLAWSPDHLDAVVDLLASLTAVDPGGDWSNRPSGSLASILCPRMPHTSAAADARLRSVGMLRRRHGPSAWDLMLSMLSGGFGVRLNVAGPLYRDWRRQEVVTSDACWSVVDSVGQMLVEDAGKDSDRWATLVGHVVDLPLAARRAAVDALREIAASSPAEAFRTAVWPELRQTVDRHREFSVADWALPESELESFDPILERLQPAADADAYDWLFASYDLMMVDGKRWKEDPEAHGAALAAKRAESVAEILAAGGIGAVLEFAETVDQPYEIGIALATNRSAALDTDVLEALHDASEPVAVAALTYFESRFGECGWGLIDRLITDHAPPAQVVADLLRAVPAVEVPWRRADALGADVADEYWTRVSPLELGTPSSLAQLRELSARLRKAGRAGAAIHLVTRWEHQHESGPKLAEEAAVCLDEWLQQQDPEDPSPVRWYELSGLMKMLDRHREHFAAGRVATLEWLCLPALAHAGDIEAPNLYRHLAQDPEFFASLVEIAYKAASWSTGDGPEPDEATRERALNAHRLLHSWPRGAFSPSREGQQDVDVERLNGWVDHARRRLEETDRQGIGDTLVGDALAASPADPDGEWPGAAVRDLIERVNSDDLDRGLITAVCNQRGGTTRSPTDGGDLERELAARYREQSRRFSQWPRTAAILDRLVATYEHEAGIHDRRAEARRRVL